MERLMELRHLRYFIAVAEEGSVTVAAERRLHTAQPSLSRQLRDLELEVGVRLMERSVRGIELTPAGRAFLDHARLAVAQAEAASEAARRAARPAKPSFAIGFLTGQEVEWLPEAMRILRDEEPEIDITIASQTSPELVSALLRGRIEAAVIRPEPDLTDLEYRLLAKEPLMAVLPSDHRLAGRDAIALPDLAGETFINVSQTAPVLRRVIDDYIRSSGVGLAASHEADHLSMAMSLVASTRGVILLPAYARHFLPWSVVGRQLKPPVPTVDLVLACHRGNRSPLLQRFLGRIDEMIARVTKTAPK
jgi:LysR family hca operon transcriptional activator